MSQRTFRQTRCNLRNGPYPQMQELSPEFRFSALPGYLLDIIHEENFV